MRHLGSPMALAVFTLGIATLCAAMAIPWAFVGGNAVGVGWLGAAAVIPSVILTAAGAFAVVAMPTRRWATGAVTIIGGLAAYMTLAGARSIPTMGAVWADADATPGPGFLVVLAAQALIVLSVWVAARSPEQRTAA